MTKAYEVELNKITASFLPFPFDAVFGFEILNTVVVEGGETTDALTDVEWGVTYCRISIDDHWSFLCSSLYEQIEENYSDLIGEKLWTLTQSL